MVNKNVSDTFRIRTCARVDPEQASTSLESERTKKRAWAGCARSFGLVCSADTQALDFVTTRA